MSEEKKKAKLERLNGCEGCMRTCPWNADVAAGQYDKGKYGCNNWGIR